MATSFPFPFPTPYILKQWLHHVSAFVPAVNKTDFGGFSATLAACGFLCLVYVQDSWFGCWLRYLPFAIHFIPLLLYYLLLHTCMPRFGVHACMLCKRRHAAHTHYLPLHAFTLVADMPCHATPDAVVYLPSPYH